MKYNPHPGFKPGTDKGRTFDSRKAAGVLLTILAVSSLAGTLYLCINHEPDNETVTFSTDCDDDGNVTEVTTSALTYLFTFTGDNADTVTWSFGDGETAEAFEVYHSYSEAGTYNIICKATNFMGSRYSGYQLVIEPVDYGFFQGYDDEVLMLGLSILFMVLAYCTISQRRERTW